MDKGSSFTLKKENIRANPTFWEVTVAPSNAPTGSKRPQLSPPLEKSKKLIFRLSYRF